MSMAHPRRSGRQAEEKKPGRHPFALQHDLLADALSELAGTLLVKNTQNSSLIMRLPSTVKGPLSSPELLVEREDVDAVGSAEFKWWDVSTLTLGAGLALDFLLSLPNNRPHSIALGSSLRFWGEVAKFSFELICRQSYLPTFHETQRRTVTPSRPPYKP